MNYLMKTILVLGLAASAALAAPTEQASAEVLATCQLKDISNAKIADLCAAISKPERYLEYFHCSPNKESGNDQVTHYIFQETYADKENYEGPKLAALFQGQGKYNQSVKGLKDIKQIDPQVDALSSSDVKFASHSNNLVFDLLISSNDGELLKGRITNTATKTVTEMTCLDISLEK
jgi:hypothetical protein